MLLYKFDVLILKAAKNVTPLSIYYPTMNIENLNIVGQQFTTF